MNVLRASPDGLRCGAFAAFGIGLALFLPASSWDGEPASLLFALGSSVVVIATLPFIRSIPVPAIAWVGISVFLAWTGSFAVGSSWASLTWVPAILAAIALGQVSKVAILSYAATLVLRDVPAMAILETSLGGPSPSGGFQFYLALVSSLLVPALLAGHRRAFSRLASWGVPIAAAGIMTVSATGLWIIVVSGSRASLVGLLVGLAATTVVLVSRYGIRNPTRTFGLLLAGAAIMTVPIDFFLSGWFAGGPPLLWSTAVATGAETVQDLRSSAPGGLATRLALWKQAWTIAVVAPVGHGPASYGHVVHAYQAAPMLWSGSPHSVWALALVETGFLGLATLMWLVVGAAWRSCSRRDAMAVGMLAAATVVMSLDVFASMPAKSLVWWATVGVAWGAYQDGDGTRSRRWSTIALGAVVGTAVLSGLVMAAVFSAPCEESCNPLERYRGNPRMAGAPGGPIAGPWTDEVAETWSGYYPLAFWLAAAAVELHDDPDAVYDARRALLRDYPYQSLERYIVVARRANSTAATELVAACGLMRFFGEQQTIWRDWRSSEQEIATLRSELETLAGGAERSEQSCRAAGIPKAPRELQ